MWASLFSSAGVLCDKAMTLSSYSPYLFLMSHDSPQIHTHTHTYQSQNSNQMVALSRDMRNSPLTFLIWSCGRQDNDPGAVLERDPACQTLNTRLSFFFSPRDLLYTILLFSEQALTHSKGPRAMFSFSGGNPSTKETFRS